MCSLGVTTSPSAAAGNLETISLTTGGCQSAMCWEVWFVCGSISVMEVGKKANVRGCVCVCVMGYQGTDVCVCVCYSGLQPI